MGIDPGDAIVAITGGARGIGRATAQSFAEAGATVAIGDLDGAAAERTAAELGHRVHPYALDVTDKSSIAAFLDNLARDLGPLDVLVNNAGIMPISAFLDETDAVTDAIFAINVMGVIHGMRLALPGMIERRSGHVVNVASLAGKLPLPGLASYCASKHAVVGLTASVRRELEGTGVTISAILPGAVDTELASGVTAPFERLSKVPPETVAQAVVRSCQHPAPEIVVPGRLAPLKVLFEVLPDPLERLARRAVGDDRALTTLRPEARSAYLDRVDAQIDGRERAT